MTVMPRAAIAVRQQPQGRESFLPIVGLLQGSGYRQQLAADKCISVERVPQPCLRGPVTESRWAQPRHRHAHWRKGSPPSPAAHLGRC